MINILGRRVISSKKSHQQLSTICCSHRNLPLISPLHTVLHIPQFRTLGPWVPDNQVLVFLENLMILNLDLSIIFSCFRMFCSYQPCKCAKNGLCSPSSKVLTSHIKRTCCLKRGPDLIWIMMENQIQINYFLVC